MAVALTVECVTTEPAFEAHRAQFIASQRYYVRGRLEWSLPEKFGNSPEAMAALRATRDALLLSAAPAGPVKGNTVDAFLQEIEFGQFGQKQGLISSGETTWRP